MKSAPMWKDAAQIVFCCPRDISVSLSRHCDGVRSSGGVNGEAVVDASSMDSTGKTTNVKRPGWKVFPLRAHNQLLLLRWHHPQPVSSSLASRFCHVLLLHHGARLPDKTPGHGGAGWADGLIDVCALA